MKTVALRSERLPGLRRPRPGHRAVLAALAAVLVAAAGCAPAITARRPSHRTMMRLEAGFTPEQIAEIEDNCGPFGMPELDAEFEHGPTDFVIRPGYVLEHSAVDKIARWVCEHVTPEELQGTSPRRNPFAPDPQLAGKPRAELDDYRGSGFDRGHLAPAGNQVRSQTDKDATFFLSNMTPQVPRHNQQIWRELEDLTRKWVGDGALASAYILTGAFFFDPGEEDPETADGFIEFELIGAGAVAVPTHYFKIVLAPDGEDGWQAVAFVQENREYKRPFDFGSDIQTIRWIEERTGLNFFPQLDPLLEQQLEEQPGHLLGSS